ncbi:uncharacterized protein N7482_003994 [Penicillium canariense]|uniref:Uncharacterized protein n=1 Tax=Penicillium canariense TaxID=189055 RepID=A0A9W9LPU6_9EURO|nr:uncharacterized protein N7482_003994 [Penicillium canariense]KAJ5168400.1 hypothetical protein N7482_003994 [Penicillium canariense]
MYPWNATLGSWAEGTGLHIDALGLVTLLGAEEMNRSIGRLVPSLYLDYLPLLGAFVVAGNQFTEKKPGFALYNISEGIMTSELAGWFSRWLQGQELHRVRSVVKWEVGERPHRWTSFLVGFLLISLPSHGILIALTVLSADWWGFANVMAMIVSVIVRRIQVAQNQAGIDANIREAQQEARKYNYPQKFEDYKSSMARLEERRQQSLVSEDAKLPTEPKDPYTIAKVIVITEDSKAVTIAVPRYLIKHIFTAHPQSPNQLLYTACQWIGWAGFAVHVISIGMAGLYTQICTVVVILVATVFTAHKVGCEDSRIWSRFRSKWRKDVDEDLEYSCWVSSSLKATLATYPVSYVNWSDTEEDRKLPSVQEPHEVKGGGRWGRRNKVDLESSLSKPDVLKNIPERRQDLYAWLDLTAEEDSHLNFWGLIPHNQEWKDIYLEKKAIHRRRLRRNQAHGMNANPGAALQ